MRIGNPQETPGGNGEFYCSIQTTGLGDDEFVQPIFGVDGFQAIELALLFIGSRLSDINAKNDGCLCRSFLPVLANFALHCSRFGRLAMHSEACQLKIGR